MPGSSADGALWLRQSGKDKRHKNYFVEELIKEYPDPKVLLVEGLKKDELSPDSAQVTLKPASRGTTEFRVL